MGSQGQHSSDNNAQQGLEKDSVENSAADVEAPPTENDGTITGAGVSTMELSNEELQLTLQDAQTKADEYWNQLLRANAELENYKRRAERDLENAHKYGLEKVAKELLPIKDSMELGLAAAEGVGEDSIKVREGIELTLKMFNTLLEKIGITEIDPQGERFNPEFHQAMSMQAAAEKEPNTVLTVYQKGYLLNGRLIRPAMVVVSTAANKTS